MCKGDAAFQIGQVSVIIRFPWAAALLFGRKADHHGRYSAIHRQIDGNVLHLDKTGYNRTERSVPSSTDSITSRQYLPVKLEVTLKTFYLVDPKRELLDPQSCFWNRRRLFGETALERLALVTKTGTK